MQQRNKCVVYLRKTKTRYYEKINEQKTVDIKQFYKVVKSLFSNASYSSNKINLTENCELVKTKIKTTEVLNGLFSNIVKILKISQYEEYDPILRNTKDSNLKVVAYKLPQVVCKSRPIQKEEYRSKNTSH